MLRKSLFTSLFLLELYLGGASNFIHAQSYPPIDTSGFYDSAHHWWDINEEVRMIVPGKNQLRYSPEQIIPIADNVLLYQKSNGGWPKNYDMQASLTEEQRRALLEGRNDLNTTFDNGATHSHIAYLAKAFTRTHEARYRDAALRGIDFILLAQYPNGGWPQFYPDTSGYRKYITFNDGAMTGVMKVLLSIVKGDPDFSFVEEDRRTKVQKAFDKGIECILKCQIAENGKLTSWCQQHDHITFRPRNARTFEPAAICNGESVEIVELLMNLKNPTPAVIRSVQCAVQWFRDSRIYNTRVQTIEAPSVSYEYHSTSLDRTVVIDSTAPPIWTRFYELTTHRPLFCNRDGNPVYTLAEVARERRTGYGWYTYVPETALNRFPEWEKKWVKKSPVK